MTSPEEHPKRPDVARDDEDGSGDGDVADPQGSAAKPPKPNLKDHLTKILARLRRED